MAQGFSLKDDLFNADTVGHLAGLFSAHLDAPVFQARVLERFPELELKERINWIATVLSEALPGGFEDKARVIRACLPPPLDPTRSDDDFGRFIYAPLGVIVEREGIEDHLGPSLSLLEELTQRFSMEFSIRAFLNRWPDETMAQMLEWTAHPHYHVRRLASEGCRPKLPWGQGIAIDPLRCLPILDLLHVDSTRFVTRSVANHLNDIAKIDADVVVSRLALWREQAKQDTKELDWMTRHATRGLVKQGHRGALELLGYRPDARVSLVRLRITPDDPAIGETAVIEAELRAERDEPLIVDYAIEYVKANGSRAAKVSKFKVTTARKGQSLILSKKHHFKGDATTFRLYPGAHRLRLMVNGTELGAVDFALREGP